MKNLWVCEERLYFSSLFAKGNKVMKSISSKQSKFGLVLNRMRVQKSILSLFWKTSKGNGLSEFLFKY